MISILKKFHLLFVFVSFFALFGCSDNSPEGVAKGFTEALYDSDFDKALTYLYYKTSSEQEKEMTEQLIRGKFETFIPTELNKIEEKFGGIKSISVDKVEMNGDDKARVKIIMQFKKAYKGVDYNIRDVKVFKVDDKWYVQI